MTAFDPVLLAVLSNRFETIVREMEHTLVRTGRSAVLSMARDSSCAIVTGRNELMSSAALLASAEGLPVHVIGMELLAEAVTDRHDDVCPGDAYLHNDPYLGNTHPADHTILVPVFVDGVHLFTTAAKAHQADIGNGLPTTYHPFAKDVYEEGALIFPAVRIQRDYTDVPDIVEMCRRRIRVPDQWYGDYLAMLGAARVGERRLQELCDRYGVETIIAFVKAWFDYSEQKMVAAIVQMDPGQVVAEGLHDPLPPVAPDGIPVRAKVAVDPVRAMIDLDLTDNIDCIQAGLNVSRACATNYAIMGVFNSLDPDIPHNTGSFRRIAVRLRDNCIVGGPVFPHSCSASTTNIGERIVMIVQRAMADRWPGYGQAEGSASNGPAMGVVAGTDARRGGESFINQFFLGSQGGPGTPTTDGWVAYGTIAAGGLMLRDSVEVDEQKYPIRVHEIRIRPDSEGAGHHRGAPGAIVEFGPADAQISVAFITDGVRSRFRGVQGGGDAASAHCFRSDANGKREPIEPIGVEYLEPGERIGQLHAGGGGYGDPRQREPARVREDVLARFISFERAREVYGVAFVEDVLDEHLTIDERATAALRTETTDRVDRRST